MSSYLNYTPIFIKVNTILKETLKMSILPISMTILLDFLTHFWQSWLPSFSKILSLLDIQALPCDPYMKPANPSLSSLLNLHPCYLWMLRYLGFVSCSPCLLSVHSPGELIPPCVFYSIVLHCFVFKLNSRPEKFSCLLITNWMFNRLGKFSASRTVLLSPLPLKINRHKAGFLSFPCITFFRTWHMINLTALEKTLEDIILFSSFSHIYHLNSHFFFHVCLWSVI